MIPGFLYTGARRAAFAAGLVIVLVIGLLAGLSAAAAQTTDNDDAALKAQIVAFLQQQNADASGKVDVAVHMSSVRMGPCHSPQPFLPGYGSRTAGRLTVGVHCPGDRPATRYIQADVAIDAPYYVAARPIEPGDTISWADIRQTDGDITQMSNSVVTHPQDVIGQVAVRRIGQAMPIRNNMVAAPKLIERGDSVQIIAQGQGFSITTRGKALDSAPRGQQLRVRTDEGRVLTGWPRDAHTVVVNP